MKAKDYSCPMPTFPTKQTVFPYKEQAGPINQHKQMAQGNAISAGKVKK